MGKKLVWYESYTTICKYSADLTDEEAKLFEEDEDKFYDEFDYQGEKELVWDEIKDEDEYDFSIEGD
jgi:HSP90 family molecular chaperone